MNIPREHRQDGFVMIEALVAILIFSLGILGMLAMSGTAISAQSDARYRTDAARLVDELASEIDLHAVRISTTAAAAAGTTKQAALNASLAAFQHQPDGTGCAFSGDASADPVVTTWLAHVTTTGPGLPGLPGTVSTGQQVIVTNTGGFNRIEITVCWKDPGTAAGTAMRRHTLVTFVN